MTSQGTIARAYLFKGDDEFHKNKELEALLASLITEEFADFDLERIDGDIATSERILAAVLIPPLGSPKRVALVRQANKINPEEQKRLASRLQVIPATGCLILVNPTPERKDGRPKKDSEVITELSKAVKAVGEVRDFRAAKGVQKSADARKIAQSVFAAAGKKLEPTAMEAFVRRTSEDLSILYSEAEKLITYAWDENVITAADVDAVTCETTEEKVFKLVDAIATRNRGESLKLLGELFLTGDDPRATAQRVLANIARQFRLIWQMRLLKEMGVRQFRKDQVPDSVKSMLPTEPNILDIASRQAWQVDKLIPQASRFDARDLQGCFEAIARADRMLKGIEGFVDDAQAVMEILVMELARGRMV